ncbi:DUF3237 domain-containing protein [Pseudorhodoferax sp. Leaf274]|uniref:DUF3237 domain-containing protein n=1 Tax=Pseudorhodoferax sp. Leaf274 TaxID=1736318 RepID=UPI000703BA73|nr:DUF3237 domain-containing protein [Pseudorhodoferax sp. Leaf274]KQP37066.1 hypothetical protein ASF44_15210 [Pseudorhodoferax sp. Leaf274]
MDSASISAPQLRPFAGFAVEVAEPQVVGPVPHGVRRVIPILGGTVQGEGWSGRVLPGGADFQLIVNEGYAELDARYVVETDGGDLVFVQNQAVRSGPPALMQRIARGEPVDPGQIYFRCQPRFETASKALGWINERLFVGSGVRRPDCVVMRFFALD